MTTTQPGALDTAGLRRVVMVLSITEITSWGVLYYAFAVLSASIVDDTGWSITAVTGAFSASLVLSGLVGVVLGRRLDEFGPRRIMTTGSVLAVVAVLAVAAAPTYHVFFAAWLLAGVAMAGVLYAPAFAAITRWAGDRRVAALTTLTLVAGLASTAFAPLAAGLQALTDWRTTYLVLAVVLGVVTVPLHWWGLATGWEPGPSPAAEDHAGSETRSLPFVALVLTATAAAFVVYAAVVNVVPLLIERGLTPGEAATGLAVGGVGQVAGRLGYARFARSTTAVSRLIIVLLAVALTTALVAVAPPTLGVLLVCAVAVGVARGIFTLIQATAISDRWGTARFGHLNGLLSAPVLLASAVAPFAGAALASDAGGQQRGFLFLAAVALLAVVPAMLTGTTGRRRT